LKKHKILNSFLILAVFLLSWSYFIRFYAIQTAQRTAHASVSPQKILSVGKDLYSEIISGGGYAGIDPKMLAEYRDELLGTIVDIDPKDMAKSYAKDSLEGRINIDQAVFDPDKVALKEGNLMSAFELGSVDLGGIQDKVGSAACELESVKQKELLVTGMLVKPIIDLGLGQMQEAAMDKLMSIINKAIKKSQEKAKKNVDKIGNGFRKSG